MHRSGTSMLAGMLAELGLFIVTRTDHNNESPLFLALERRLLRYIGGFLQYSRAFYPLLEDAAARAIATGYFRRGTGHSHGLLPPRPGLPPHHRLSRRVPLPALSHARQAGHPVGLEIARHARHDVHVTAVAGSVP